MPKFIEETREHVCVKKALGSKNKNVFDFMLYPSNNKVPVIDSLILKILKKIVKNSKANNGSIGVEVDYIENLLNVINIEGDLIDMCISEEIYTQNQVYKAIQVTVACIQTTSRLWILKMKDSDNDILVFDISEVVTSELEKKITKTLTINHIKKDQLESLVVLLSKSIDIFLALKIMNVKVVNNKSKSLKIIELVSNKAESVNNEPEIFPNLPANNKLKSSNEELSEDSDKFVIITKKDKLNFIVFCDRMQTDVRIYNYVKKAEDSSKYMDILVRERLIEEEIIWHKLKEKGIISLWLNTDKE
ncbi:1278_t:CDS:2 [Cetraspora pellucida]|uniref:1278_t:CDS:1 n=1 Tax=Cetraspora pellucida TaxID=1433469 RepID=A0A9N9BSP3_9GLOM|nr:1278_t:CDS:2 [Cetraspora pellucida]